MILNTLFEKVNGINTSNTYLYFITRVLKPEIKKSSKVLDKFNFKLYQIDINDEIRNHLYSLTQQQLEYLIKKKTELHDYDVITDDTQQLFTYSMTNKAMSFSDVITNQLKKSPPKIKNLEEIITEEELWAYCVGLYDDIDDWVYTFRKILSGKVAVDEKDSNTKSKFSKAIRTIFNTKSQKLELIEGETIHLDKQIDCIYYNETFYIAKKTQFEQIVGLQEEYKSQAEDVVDELGKTNMIEGIEVLKKQVSDNPALHKKLVRLYKIGNYKTLNKTVITRMKSICKKYGDTLKVKNGKLLLEDETDINLALKMLVDFYKKGEVSGKSYGTYAGREIAIPNNTSN